MIDERVIEQIRSSWRRFYPSDKKGKGIICPNCESGSGKNGTGIVGDENHGKPYNLRCWNCDFSGDVIDLKQKETGLNFTDAVKVLADEIGINIENYEATSSAPKPKPRKEPEPIEDYSLYYRQCQERIEEPAALSYLNKRGISLKTAQRYGIGYDAAWKSPTVIKRQQAKGSEWTPPATARLIMPVSKNHYIARAISESIQEHAKMNETGGGSAGIFNTKALSEASAGVFVVEGLIDALSVIEVGAQAIALNSTSNIKLLLDLIKKQKPKAPLILCLDNDDAGQRAQAALKSGLKEVGACFIEADITGGYKDANEALTGDISLLKAAVEKAEAEAKQMGHSLLPIGDFIGSFRQHREEVKQNIRTGIKPLDIALGGGFRDELYIMAAQTGTGKSAIASVIAQNMAQSGANVLYYALEMGRDEFIARGTSAISKELNENPIKYGDILNEQYNEHLDEFCRVPFDRYEKHLKEYAERYGEHLYIIEGGTVGVCAKDILKSVVDFKKTHPEKPIVVFVDYLQLLSADPEDKTQRDLTSIMSAAVKTLKVLASQKGAAVFLISSMANDKNGAKVAETGFKYSGDITYTGGVLLGWNWDGVTNPESEDRKTQIIQESKRTGCRIMTLEVLKNRSGERDKEVKLKYYPAYNLIVSADNTEHDKFIPLKPGEVSPFEQKHRI